ncbi:amino acid transporter AVT1I-like [Juglans regia]|uniref:Amino acid transporter AVT1I-like n=2 Tax=Juglans regia TaxID=51240 RepID=A0A2I4GVL7_JUGRE|nr:amino acid transporter AVT1I-like [Juglans regia]
MLLTDLSILSYVSAMGVFTCIVIVGSIFCVGALGGVGFQAKGTLLNVDGIPTAVSLYIVCFGGHPAVPSIYITMRERYHFSKVLLSSYSITMLTYMLTAVVGYLMYGDNVESQITLNLPSGEVGAKVAIYFTLLIPITKYTLVITPVATALERELSANYRNWRPLRMLIRIGLLTSTAIVAHVFPYFENLMAIIGSIFVVAASFVLPCLCYLKIVVSLNGWSNKLMGVVAIIVFGSVAGILGTYSAFVDL